MSGPDDFERPLCAGATVRNGSIAALTVRFA